MRSILVHPIAACARLGRAAAACLGRAADACCGRAAPVGAAVIAAAASLVVAPPARADTDHERVGAAASVLHAFTSDEQGGIPADLLSRARGVAVIPNVIRGGFLLGARRGRGVLTVRTPDGRFANPAFITLTGGSIGGQIGIESADVVLVFANERAVRNIEDGKFTLGGDVTTVAGPTGRSTTVALTGRAEVYAYIRNRGLFAGAAFEGARLDVDEQGTARFYSAARGARAFDAPSGGTPESARPFLTVLERAAAAPTAPGSAARRDAFDSQAPKASQAPEAPEAREASEEARTFPLGGAR